MSRKSLLKQEFFTYLSKKNSTLAEQTRRRLIRSTKLWATGTVSFILIGNLYRLWYYWEYELDMMHPKIPDYYTKRLSTTPHNQNP